MGQHRVGNMTRKWLIAPIILAALAGLDTLLWRVAATQLAAGVDRWTEDAGRQGWVVTQGPRLLAGWPFAARLVIGKAAITGGVQLVPGGLSWFSQRIVLTVSLFHPTRLQLQAGGQQNVTLSGLPDIAFTGTLLAASIRLWGGGQNLAQLHAAGVSGGLAGSRHTQDVQVAGLDLGLADVDVGGADAAHAWPSARLDVHASGIGLPDTGQWPLGALVSVLDATLMLKSPAAPASGPGNMQTQARAWRDGGGRLDARNLRLRWGPLDMRATASLGLDARLQPAGAGRADVAGSQATLQALAGGGVITPGLAATGSAVLAFMPQAPDGAVRLPFILRDSTFSVGNVPVFQMKDLVWRTGG